MPASRGPAFLPAEIIKCPARSLIERNDVREDRFAGFESGIRLLFLVAPNPSPRDSAAPQQSHEGPDRRHQAVPARDKLCETHIGADIRASTGTHVSMQIAYCETTCESWDSGAIPAASNSYVITR